jgi:hypothetical protein
MRTSKAFERWWYLAHIPRFCDGSEHWSLKRLAWRAWNASRKHAAKKRVVMEEGGG